MGNNWYEVTNVKWEADWKAAFIATMVLLGVTFISHVTTVIMFMRKINEMKKSSNNNKEDNGPHDDKKKE